jgi:hypothetical protein
MKTLCLNKFLETKLRNRNLYLTVCIALFFFSVIAQVSTVSAQKVLFDFNDAPLLSPLPISQTVNGITAHFSATGQGYSIQNANTMGFLPQGFSGRCIYPSSIYLADLLIKFDQQLTGFSIMYACQELGCDDAATMRVTAYMKGSLAGTNTMTAKNPGTWPVDTLRCSFPQGFDSVVVHYDSPPPTCKDYGVIFLADNMLVTPLIATAISNLKIINNGLIAPNPVSQSTTISFTLLQSEYIHVAIYDITGRLVKNLFNGTLDTGEQQIIWEAHDDAVKEGVYYLNLSGKNFSQTCKLIVAK